jgi:hypothetical protein
MGHGLDWLPKVDASRTSAIEPHVAASATVFRAFSVSAASARTAANSTNRLFVMSALEAPGKLGPVLRGFIGDTYGA